MRPFRSSLLLLVILICFAGLSYILPWNLGLPPANVVLPAEILKYITPTDTISDFTDPEVRPGFLEDKKQSDYIRGDSIRISADSTSKVVQPDSLLTRSHTSGPLEIFLDSVARSKGQVRVFYYGDSQIEGDRVSSYLRQSLRKNHSGTGPGLFLPVMTVPYTKTFYVRASSNWKRYNYLSFRNGEISHNDLGPLMAFCRYMPEGETANAKVKSWIRITPSIFADSAASKFEYLKIFYRNNLGRVAIDIKADNHPVIRDSLNKSQVVTEFVCPVYNSENILIDFSGYTSPDIFGISIESNKGVIVDNIPQRGSAGLEFTMTDKENLRQAFRLLSPDLIILHYGLNLVRNIRNDYTYYEKGLSRQVSLLREISPGSAVIVVGLTDMAYPEGDEIRSYPNIPVIIDAQKKAAEESGAIFWDAYKAMGGNSSIIKWFNMDPPLAKKDYVHFTDQGADTIADMMVKDLFAFREPVKIVADSLPLSADSEATKHATPAAENQSISYLNSNKGVVRSLINGIFNYDPSRPFIFTSPAFWLFFLVVLLGYSLFYKKMIIRNIYLFLISLFFYYKTGGFFLFILIFVTVVDYICGLLIHNAERKPARRFFLLLSLVSNLGLLAYFKYTGFIVNSVNNIVGTDFKVVDLLSSLSNSVLGTSFDISYIILPVGISFFTFQSLSYTIDVYRRKMEPVRNIIDFGFYVSFFPHLVAGPIVRASVFIPQIYQEFHLTKREFSHSLYMILKGLIKKIIISNFIAVNLVDRVFDVPSAYSGLENLLAVYGYGLQIYCDFSGYTDIAIGVALILGFRLPVNFNSPYKAINISDFWKRWHISLSQWLKDYLYIPLGGNRKGKIRTLVNLMVTMLLGGLWHGADLRFIIWGGLHGIGLAINKIRSYIIGDTITKNWMFKAISIFVTFQFVSFCWIFFRANDTHSAFLVLRQIFQSFLPSSFSDLLPVYSGVVSMILAGYMIHFIPERLKESYRGVFIKIPVAAQMVIVLLVGFMLYQMRTTEIMPFIYFRF